ncbi:hypothetical protein QR680_009648 [Steinernema hermaphroditum]|uniref:Uncharacterized protein n=1 Tax=Steinernema hermaphroditum TaxID=289476 RepID=A0AA39IMI4_9BILA|nr:hypothetical protein QR680_009648 [Steinernema hermaphroditum]
MILLVVNHVLVVLRFWCFCRLNPRSCYFGVGYSSLTPFQVSKFCFRHYKIRFVFAYNISTGCHGVHVSVRADYEINEAMYLLRNLVPFFYFFCGVYHIVDVCIVHDYYDPDNLIRTAKTSILQLNNIPAFVVCSIFKTVLRRMAGQLTQVTGFFNVVSISKSVLISRNSDGGEIN